MGSGRCLQSYISLQVMGITHGCRFKAFHCLVFQTPKLRPSFILFKYTIHIYKCHLISYYFYQYFTNIQWLHIFSKIGLHSDHNKNLKIISVRVQLSTLAQDNTKKVGAIFWLYIAIVLFGIL